jgi:DNA polymerase III subunit delta'
MTLAEIAGQDRAVGTLQRALAAGRLAHAYLFTGPPGVGKRTTALALAQACVCPAAPGRGCGTCSECHLIGAGSHPDVFVEDLARAQLERQNTTHLSIEQIRRVRAQLGLRPVRGRCKFGLIEPADRMTVDAQNALLKTLEEPLGAATLVLVTTNAETLLQTIRSRCQMLRFTPLADEIVERILIAEGVPDDAARGAVALADGSVDSARELAVGEDAERCRELRAELDRLERMAVPEVLDLAASLAPPRTAREQQAAYAAAVVAWCRLRLHRAAAKAAPRTTGGPHGEEALEAVRDEVRRLVRAYATSRDLERNANAHLAWDALLLDLRASLRAGA